MKGCLVETKPGIRKPWDDGEARCDYEVRKRHGVNSEPAEQMFSDPESAPGGVGRALRYDSRIQSVSRGTNGVLVAHMKVFAPNRMNL